MSSKIYASTSFAYVPEKFEAENSNALLLLWGNLFSKSFISPTVLLLLHFCMAWVATHAIQKCNNNKTVGEIKDLENKLPQSKRRALEFSASNFSGTYAKEVEAYIFEDKPKKVKRMIKKYCL
mgnify:CR=1 FL=1